MILGASHLTFSSADPEAARRLFPELGFRLDFDERAVPNSPEKAPFLSPAARSAKTMSISYFKAALGPAVELVAYPSPGAAGRGFLPAFAGGFPAPLRASVPDWDRAPKAALPAAAPGRGIAAIACPAQNMDDSISFWRNGLGFTAVSQAGTDWARLELPAALPQWRLALSLFADDRPAAPAPALDDLGFLCLSLLSSDVDQDLEHLGRTGAAERTASFELTVNGKKLRAGMVRGPGREIVELLQVAR